MSSETVADLRLAILVGGDLPPGWRRIRWEGAEHHHLHRRYDIADPTVKPWLQRSCHAEVHQDGRWSIRGNDGSCQYSVRTGRAPDALQAVAVAERVATEWMALPMGSLWPDEPGPDAWTEFARYRWAATRYLVVREDGPRPWNSSLREWRPEFVGGVIVTRELCGASPTPPAFLPDPARLGELSRDDRESFQQVQPLLEAGEVLFRDTRALVFRPGERWPVAMVSLWVPDEYPRRVC